MESDGFAARVATTMEARVAADGVCSWYTSPPAKRPRGHASRGAGVRCFIIDETSYTREARSVLAVLLMLVDSDSQCSRGTALLKCMPDCDFNNFRASSPLKVVALLGRRGESDVTTTPGGFKTPEMVPEGPYYFIMHPLNFNHSGDVYFAMLRTNSSGRSQRLY